MDNDVFVLATVMSVTGTGNYARIKLDGADTATAKPYKILATGVTLAADDRVLAARVSGTLVILGKIPS